MPAGYLQRPLSARRTHTGIDESPFRFRARGFRQRQRRSPERVDSLAADAPIASAMARGRTCAIVVNFNGAGVLARCLQSLLAQTVAPDEIIVVDNASDDGSAEIAAGVAGVRLIALEENAGFARANNFAIAAAGANCDWIALVNPDAFLDRNWLAAMLAAAEAHPQFDCFASCQLDTADPTRIDGTGDAYHFSGLAWRIDRGQSNTRDAGGSREVFSACAAAALYSRDALVAVGGFDEDFFCYFEDVDLGFRLRLAGHRCLYVPGAIARHVGSALTGGAKGNFAAYHGHRNLVWCFVKNMPGPLFWLLLPAHLALNILGIIALVWRGQAAVAFAAKRDALAGLASAWRKRREIQKRRVATLASIWRILDKGSSRDSRHGRFR